MRFPFNINLIILALFIFSLSLNVSAEKVKPLNPDCKVCPVVISYGKGEAKDILGPDVMNQIRKLGKLEQKTIKIDLDGIKQVGSEKSSDEGYELIVNANKNIIAIVSIQDSSAIKIRTDNKNLALHGDMNKWTPETELTPSHKIEKSDDLEFAWEKMKASRMYGYVNNGIDHREWNNKIKKFILNVLGLLN